MMTHQPVVNPSRPRKAASGCAKMGAEATITLPMPGKAATLELRINSAVLSRYF
jgi:hypothetical protein